MAFVRPAIGLLGLVLISCGGGTTGASPPVDPPPTNAPPTAPPMIHATPVIETVYGWGDTDTVTNLYAVAGDSLTCFVIGEATDPDGDSLTYRYEWKLRDSPVIVTGSSLSSTRAGQTWECWARAWDGWTSGPAKVLAVHVGTVVQGPQTIAQDTTWAAAASPYILRGQIDLEHPATLTVDRGVTIVGDNGHIVVFGTFRVVGSATQPVTMVSAAVYAAGTQAKPHLIDLNFLRFESWREATVGSGIAYGTLLVRDSVMTGLDPKWNATLSAMTVLRPISDCVIERNTFENYAVIVEARLSTSSHVFVRNNLFRGTASYVQVMDAYNPVIIEKNSFPSSLYRVRLGGATANADARSNYWSGASDSDVANLIYDRSVDPMFEMDVPYLPTLSAPDPATPAP